jgi:predicted transcriptional regulator of viral defense system
VIDFVWSYRQPPTNYTMTTSTQRDRTRALLQAHGILRLTDLTAQGIHAPALARMVQAGEITRPARGLYELADAPVSLNHSLAEIAVRVPKAVICLVSAAAFHEITLQSPRSVWIAIGESDRKPKIAHVATRVLHFGAAALSRGVETIVIDGVAVPIFSPAKTVVDCFRYRRLVGLDVAFETLRLAVRSKKATPNEIVHLAQALRIWSVLRPYLESVVADDG